MNKLDEQLIVAVLNQDIESACQSLDQGAQANQIVKQTHSYETTEGRVSPLCTEKIESLLMIACRLGLHKVVVSMLEHGADTNFVDKGQTYNSYKEKHPLLEVVLRSNQEFRKAHAINAQRVRD